MEITSPVMRNKKEEFIMFREIRKSERITEEDRKRREEERKYLEIKPQNTSIDDLKAFWNLIFQGEES
jgi:hypothetical protein